MRYNDLTDFEEINISSRKEEEVEVTILCTTYNQKDYIRDALNSFLNQDTDLCYEILIYDDSSTDGTSQIIREFATNYPNLIKAFIAHTNTYTHPLRRFAYNAWQREFSRGKYIAFCEGDDFWVDNKKIQKQWEALEKHKECDMCACWGCTVSEDGKTEISQIRPKTHDGILTTQEVILGGGQYLVSSGLFYRKKLKEETLEFEKISGLDYVLQIRGSLRGGIYYIDQKMAAYRRYTKGSWTMRVLRDKEKLNEQWNIERKMLRELDIDTKGEYNPIITKRLESYITFLEQLNYHRDEIINLLNSLNGKCYLWGMGRRGLDFEEFCYQERIEIKGVCDAVDEKIGEKTRFGFKIYRTKDVKADADIILATNSFAYDDLRLSGFGGKIINLQKYMPLG